MLHHGDKVTLNCTLESAQNLLLIPKTCVKLLDQKNGMILTLRQGTNGSRTEHYVHQTSVVIQELNEEWVAIAGSIQEPIVEFYDEQLNNMDIVRIVK